MQSARIDDLLRLGPNERIIFAPTVESAPEVARQIASLANTQGGTIAYGIKSRRTVSGVPHPQDALTTISRAAQLVSPALLIEPQIVSVGNKSIITIDVPQGFDTPYTAADGHILVRRGRKIVPADAERAAELARRAFSGAELVPIAPPTQRLQPKSAPPPTIDLDHIMLKLERLIIANAELAQRLDAANSWRSRITDQLIGAVLGMVISLVVFYVLGVG